MWKGHTVHKVRAVDQESSTLCIVITEDSIVHKVPAKSVGDEHNYTLRCDTFFRLCNISLKAVDCGFFAGRMAARDASLKACGTGHFVVFGALRSCRIE